MRVHIVIEWAGNSQEIDSATVHGVYSDPLRAERAAATLHPARWADVQIIEREVDEEVSARGDDHHRSAESTR